MPQIDLKAFLIVFAVSAGREVTALVCQIPEQLMKYATNCLI